jgi:hypothetical protein
VQERQADRCLFSLCCKRCCGWAWMGMPRPTGGYGTAGRGRMEQVTEHGAVRRCWRLLASWSITLTKRDSLVLGNALPLKSSLHGTRCHTLPPLSSSPPCRRWRPPAAPAVRTCHISQAQQILSKLGSLVIEACFACICQVCGSDGLSATVGLLACFGHQDGRAGRDPARDWTEVQCQASR